MPSIWIGFDPREVGAFAVACASVRERVPADWPVRGLVLSDLRARGLYRRPTEMHPGVDRAIMWDVISEAPMSTEHANSRFLVPHLAKTGWALFMDGDMLVRGDLKARIESLDPQFAVYCVKHHYDPPVGPKMDGQEQTRYRRKNWSSFMAFNCDHEANRSLTVDIVNTLPGRDLHRFCWLSDEEIGELDPSWNFLVGHTDPSIEPNVIHWTLGVPDMRGYEDAAFADEWRAKRDQWAASALSLPG